MIRIVKVSLILLLQLGICVNVNAQGRFVSDRVAVTAGVDVSTADGVTALGVGTGIFFDGVEVGIQRTKVSSDGEDDDLTSYAVYFLG